MSVERRVVDLLGTELPLVLAPMAGPGTVELARAVCEAGGLGSLACAMSSADAVEADVAALRARTSRPFALNFFCHSTPPADAARDAAWRQRLLVFGPAPQAAPAPERRPFDEAACALVERLRPPVVSFHFGLPEPSLLERVKASGAAVLSSATTVREARWLEEHGCDAVIAQGLEAGGHRAMFLTDDVATQVGTFALVPQIVDAVRVPVIAAGGIADARGIAAAFALGASAVQLGTAYLRCPEAALLPAHRTALRASTDDATVVTNVFSGRPARGIVNRVVREVGPMADDVPAFPHAAAALSGLRKAAEAAGSVDFTPLWAGQSSALARDLPAGELTRVLMAEARSLLEACASRL